MAVPPSVSLRTKTFEERTVVEGRVSKNQPQNDCVFIGQRSLRDFPDRPADSRGFIKDYQNQLALIVQPGECFRIELVPSLEIRPVVGSIFLISDADSCRLHIPEIFVVGQPEPFGAFWLCFAA